MGLRCLSSSSSSSEAVNMCIQKNASAELCFYLFRVSSSQFLMSEIYLVKIIFINEFSKFSIKFDFIYLLMRLLLIE